MYEPPLSSFLVLSSCLLSSVLFSLGELNRSGLSHLSLQEKAPGSSIFLTHAEGCRRRAGRVIDGELSIHSLCLRWLVKVPLQFTTKPLTERIHSVAHQLMITSLTGCCQCSKHTGSTDMVHDQGKMDLDHFILFVYFGLVDMSFIHHVLYIWRDPLLLIIYDCLGKFLWSLMSG